MWIKNNIKLTEKSWCESDLNVNNAFENFENENFVCSVSDSIRINFFINLLLIRNVWYTYYKIDR